jgi:hypothetical protein
MGWRRFLPGKRRDRREDHVIQAFPISEAGALLREEESDPEEPYGQQQCVSSLALLFIDNLQLILPAIP